MQQNSWNRDIQINKFHRFIQNIYQYLMSLSTILKKLKMKWCSIEKKLALLVYNYISKALHNKKVYTLVCRVDLKTSVYWVYKICNLIQNKFKYKPVKKR